MSNINFKKDILFVVVAVLLPVAPAGADCRRRTVLGGFTRGRPGRLGDAPPICFPVP
jgi:hypothetical protein